MEGQLPKGGTRVHKILEAGGGQREKPAADFAWNRIKKHLGVKSQNSDPPGLSLSLNIS